jgi:hypothetical protein
VRVLTSSKGNRFASPPSWSYSLIFSFARRTEPRTWSDHARVLASEEKLISRKESRPMSRFALRRTETGRKAAGRMSLESDKRERRRADERTSLDNGSLKS